MVLFPPRHLVPSSLLILCICCGGGSSPSATSASPSSSRDLMGAWTYRQEFESSACKNPSFQTLQYSVTIGAGGNGYWGLTSMTDPSHPEQAFQAQANFGPDPTNAANPTLYSGHVNYMHLLSPTVGWVDFQMPDTANITTFQLSGKTLTGTARGQLLDWTTLASGDCHGTVTVTFTRR